VARLKTFEGINALVTGASSGIGRLLSLRLAAEGARLALVARREAELRVLAEEINGAGGTAMVAPCDVADRDQALATAAMARAELGPIDLLVNNAGYGHHRPFLEWDVEDMERMMRVNYLGSLYFTRALIEDMAARRRGWIVFIASVAGKLAPPDETAYVASKFAQVGLASSLTMEMEDHGVHVLNVCPGAIRTPFFDNEALSRLPPVARKQMAEPEGLVEAIVTALRKGKREITYPGWIRVAYPFQALFPRVFRWQMKKRTLGAIK